MNFSQRGAHADLLGPLVEAHAQGAPWFFLKDPTEGRVYVGRPRHESEEAEAGAWGWSGEGWRFGATLTVAPAPLMSGEWPTPTGTNAAPEHEVDTGFEAGVQRALAALRTGALEKVVLARRVPWAGEGHVPSPISVLRALLSAQPTAYVFGVGQGVQSFVGASPELLLRVRTDNGARQLETEALAGTAPRSEAPQRLLESAKDRHEHAVVVDAIRAAISPHCEPGSVHVPATPEVVTLPNLHHLRTPISGRLRPGVSPRAVLSALHPTPAVCGTPRAEAQAWLAANEGFPRALYAGPVGFDTPDRSLWVVGLRCAHLTDTSATLYAGVGLVSASEPARELAETSLKLSVMRSALRQAALEAP